MCDYADEMWNSKARWQKYVDARVLEITCGEAVLYGMVPCKPSICHTFQTITVMRFPYSERVGFRRQRSHRYSSKVISRLLSDPHLKVLHYEQDASRIFANTEIKGGVGQGFGCISVHLAVECQKRLEEYAQTH